MPSVEFLGVGDATDFTLGQTSTLYRGSCCLLVDCGPQVPATVARSINADELDGVYLTHTHADHCFGLPSLLLWMRQSGRKRSLSLLAETSSLASILQLLEQGYPGAFVPAKCFRIEPQPLAPGGVHEVDRVQLSIAATEHNVPNFALRIDDRGSACAFSGDGRPNHLTSRLFAGIDLLTQECAYLDRASHGHANVANIMELLRTALPRRTALVHCMSSERAQIEARLAAEFADRVVFPRPGDRLELRPL